MEIIITESVLAGSKNGISLPGGADHIKLQLHRTEVSASENAILVRDDVCRTLGLPANIDPEIVREVIFALSSVRSDSPEVQRKTFLESRLAAMISVGANIATIIPYLVGLLPK